MDVVIQDKIITPLNTLLSILGKHAFDYVDESVCQRQIGDCLTSYGIEFEREFRLSGKDRIDFYFPRSGIGLEIKAGKLWSKLEVYRQLERYASHETINGLILATGRAQGLPLIINDKPVRLHSMGAAHL